MKNSVLLALVTPLAVSAIAIAQTATPVPSVPLASVRPADTTCPATSGAYYKNGAEWVSMDPSHAIGFKSTGIAKAAFSYGAAAAKWKAQFRDSRSPYQLRDANLAICLVGVTDQGRDITVAKLQEEKDHRELAMAKIRLWTGVNAQLDQSSVIPVDVKKLSDKIYFVTSKQPIPQGEFILFTIIPDVAAMVKANTATSLGGYDFGNHAK